MLYNTTLTNRKKASQSRTPVVVVVVVLVQARRRGDVANKSLAQILTTKVLTVIAISD